MMPTTRTWLGALTLVALAAPGTFAEADRSSSCASLRVVTPEAVPTAKRRSRTRTPSFSASQILDLEIQVFLSPKVKGTQAGNVELKVYTPKGHLYQTLTAVFPSASSPDEESQGRRRRREPSATAVLPVAGTTIVTSSLYGSWRVEAHVGGNAAACSRPQEFVIEP